MSANKAMASGGDCVRSGLPFWVQALGNGTLFNISWLVIVLSESAVISLAQLALHLLLHFLWIGRGVRELRFIAAVFAAGWLLDQGLFATSVFTVNGQAASAPLWLSCLWPVFASTLCHAFSGLRSKLPIAAALGAISGTASYVAGTRLTAVDFGDPLLSPLVLAVLWAIAFPALLVAAHRWVTVPDERQQGVAP